MSKNKLSKGQQRRVNANHQRRLKTSKEKPDYDDNLFECPVLADFRAVKDGNVFCTTNDMYQQSMSIGYMIDDMHSMITGAPDSGMKYLFKLNRKINSTKR